MEEGFSPLTEGRIEIYFWEEQRRLILLFEMFVVQKQRSNNYMIKMAAVLLPVYAFVRNCLEEKSTTCPAMLLIVIATQYSLNNRILFWSVNNCTQIKENKKWQ